MASKIFTAPDEVGPFPKFDYKNFDASQKAEQKWIEKLQKWCKQNGKGSMAGKLYRVPVADGCAVYVVFSGAPLQLVHVPAGDAYQMNAVYARGLKAADVKKAIERDEQMTSIFAAKGQA